MAATSPYTFGIHDIYLKQVSHLGSDVKSALEQALVDVCLEEVAAEQVVEHWYKAYGYKPNASQIRRYPNLISADSFKKWFSQLKNGQHDNANNLIIIYAAFCRVLQSEGKSLPTSVTDLFYAQGSSGQHLQVSQINNELSIPRIEVLEAALSSDEKSDEKLGEKLVIQKGTELPKQGPKFESRHIWTWGLPVIVLAVLVLIGIQQLSSSTAGDPKTSALELEPEIAETPVLPQSLPLMNDPEKDMVELPGSNNFHMGCSISSECVEENQPIRTVVVKPFSISRYEVSFELFDQFCEEVGHPRPRDFGWGRGQHPVVDVTWYDVTVFIDWLNKKADEEGANKKFRLPTEAEWEYAARANSHERFSWGVEADSKFANGDQQYGWPDDGFVNGTAPIASFEPNIFGLYDMAGNVAEWVSDCWHDNYNGAPTLAQKIWQEDQAGNCERRVHRGGGHRGPTTTLWPTRRNWKTKDYKNDYIGFRLVQVP